MLPITASLLSNSAKRRGRNCSVLVPCIAWKSKGLTWSDLDKAARKELLGAGALHLLEFQRKCLTWACLSNAPRAKLLGAYPLYFFENPKGLAAGPGLSKARRACPLHLLEFERCGLVCFAQSTAGDLARCWSSSCRFKEARGHEPKSHVVPLSPLWK